MNAANYKPIESGEQYPANVSVEWYWRSANGTFSHRELFYHDLEGALELCRKLARDFQTTKVLLRFDTENTGDQLNFYNTFGHLQGKMGVQLDLNGNPMKED